MSARKVDHGRLRALHAAKLTMAQIAHTLGVGLTAVKDNCRFLGLRRGKGWKPPGYGARQSAAVRESHRRRNPPGRR